MSAGIERTIFNRTMICGMKIIHTGHIFVYFLQISFLSSLASLGRKGKLLLDLSIQTNVIFNI